MASFTTTIEPGTAYFERTLAEAASGQAGSTSTAPALKCDLNNVDCSQIGCLAQCGIFDSFENQTNCFVIVELLMPRATDWTPIGPQFHPSERWILTKSAFYLPADTLMRAVHAKSGVVLKDFGAIGKGRRALVLEAGACRSVTHGGDDDDDTTFQNSDFQSVKCYRSGASAAQVAVSIAVLVVAALVMLGVGAFVVFSQKQTSSSPLSVSWASQRAPQWAPPSSAGPSRSTAAEIFELLNS
jgi:hypothetical protein